MGILEYCLSSIESCRIELSRLNEYEFEEIERIKGRIDAYWNVYDFINGRLNDEYEEI